MPNPNAIVSTRIRFDPPLAGRDIAEAVRDREQAVDVGGDRRIRLDPADARSVGFATVLNELAGMGLPAYLELDPDSGSIDRLLIPTLGRVLSVRARGAGGGIEVQLDRSHARHVVPGDSPDLDVLGRTLRTALESKRPVLVVTDFQGAIIDVRDFTPDPEGPLPPLPEPGDEPIPFPWRPRRWWEWVLWPIWKLLWWIRYPWFWWHCPSKVQAQAIFDAMAATSCDPLTVPVPCIPFKYPDDGCWARANEMCRLMVALGGDPAKVWIDGGLKVNSVNEPWCLVEWGWHVAPTICVRGGGWLLSTTRMVVDPSLFTTPVTEAQWKAKQGDPNATLTDTGRDIYIRPPFSPLHDDASYTATKADLAYYRLQLYNRSIQIGPPPYPCP